MAVPAQAIDSTISSGPRSTLGLAHRDAEKIARKIATVAGFIFAVLLVATAFAAVGVATGGAAAIPLWLLIATNLSGAVALGAAIISQVAFSRMSGNLQTQATSQDGEVDSSVDNSVGETVECCCLGLFVAC